MMDKYTHAELKAGQRLWNGVTVSEELARAYNSLNERIDQFRADGLTVPEHLLNGRHNLING